MKIIQKHLRVLLCMMLTAALVLSMGGVVSAEETEDTTTIGAADTESNEIVYELVAKNDRLALYADKTDGYFYVENRETGKKWYSTPADIEEDPYTVGLESTNLRSHLVVEYISREREIWADYAQSTNSYTDCVEHGGVTVTVIDNGIRVDYLFPILEIQISVNYVLKDTYLEASLLTDAIKDEGEYAVIAVQLLPVFGAGSWRDTGYLFVPDGSGALIHFNNQRKLAQNYRAPVYGVDKQVVAETKSTSTEAIRLPVFGTVVGDEALMAVIDQAAASAEITAMTGHATCGYNAVSSIFGYRLLTSQYNMYNRRRVNQMVDLDHGTDAYAVRYYPLSGEDADYIGMAGAYRDYLIAEHGFQKRDTTPSFHVDLIGAYETEASFLGIIPYTKKVPLTTYEQAQTILAGLQSAGITKLSAQYTGWNNNGITNVKIPKAATPLSVLGGKKDFAALTAATASSGVTLSTSVDLTSFIKGGNGVSATKHAIRTPFGKTVKQPQYILSNHVTKLGADETMYLSTAKLTDVAARYLESLKKQGLTTVDLTNIAENCYSNYFEDDTAHRTVGIQNVVAALKAYQDAGIKVTVQNANAYALPYVNVVTDVPTVSSGYDIFDEDVPFYQALLHGYVPYTTRSITQTPNPGVTYLTAVESGSQLQYNAIHANSGDLFDTEYNYLYGSTWTLWKDTAAKQYAEYQPLLEKVHDQEIVNHAQVAQNVFVTEYQNGVKVAVNYNAQDVVVEGNTVPAQSFCEWEVIA
ncbi:MAG: hypothetical protein IJP14_02335 [Clostridia bacterium]|nr:hypothetical protein [Clostridia bacterium]